MRAAKIYIFFVSNILFAYLVYHITSIYDCVLYHIKLLYFECWK